MGDTPLGVSMRMFPNKHPSGAGKIHQEWSLPIPWARVQGRIRRKWTKGHTKEVYFLTVGAVWSFTSHTCLHAFPAMMDCNTHLLPKPLTKRNLSFLKLLFGVFCYSTTGIANTGCILHSILRWTCLSDPPGHTRFFNCWCQGVHWKLVCNFSVVRKRTQESKETFL